jgi:hypothetical protein
VAWLLAKLNTTKWQGNGAVSTVFDFVIAQLNRTRGPNLPEPFRFFDAIVVLGTARVPIFGATAALRR